MNNTLGQNIKLYREKFNYSQETVADFLGVKREMISYYENDSREIPVEKLNRLADLFGVELLDLLEEKPDLVTLNSVFAFRADELIPTDLTEIASFRKIVKNYVKMVRLESGNE